MAAQQSVSRPAGRTPALLIGRGRHAEALRGLGLGDIMASAMRARLAQPPGAAGSGSGRHAGHYNPNEPRDWHGRWTQGSGGAAKLARALPARPAGATRGLLDRRPDRLDQYGRGGPYGGRLTRIGGKEDDDFESRGIGDNLPPEPRPQWKTEPKA